MLPRAVGHGHNGDRRGHWVTTDLPPCPSAELCHPADAQEPLPKRANFTIPIPGAAQGAHSPANASSAKELKLLKLREGNSLPLPQEEYFFAGFA